MNVTKLTENQIRNWKLKCSVQKQPLMFVSNLGPREVSNFG